ncbi:MAG TPA: quinone-dependent dihydroorotate dehydrogenase [Chryseolinea sp.]|nr:quinone-dependent dihydroorotate dehydrogenase [Chryseolinea sp.]
MYKWLIRPLFFSIDAEKIHHIVFKSLKFASKIPGLTSTFRGLYCIADKRLEKKILGLTFKNPVGLAAGFDKDAKLIDELDSLGFGFIEIGTVTPLAQGGNDKPRLFRLPKDKALINRMGFNNEGVEAAMRRLREKKSNIIVGGNIGKNKVTPNEEALNDYAICFEVLFPYVDYFVLNISSPNTPGLRELQDKEPLGKLLLHVKQLSTSKPLYKPLFLKIAPDLVESQLDDIIEILKETKLDGVVATNTTISRDGLITKKEEVQAIGSGGLSGKPLTARSTDVIRYLRQKLGPDFPIIGVGGIMSTEDALEKLKAGADLIQIYTGFIYEGPEFVKEINKAILQNLEV